MASHSIFFSQQGCDIVNTVILNSFKVWKTLLIFFISKKIPLVFDDLFFFFLNLGFAL